MRLSYRIRKLEKSMIDNREHWAFFTIGFYEDLEEGRLARECLVADYIAQGNARPTHCVFINEIPGPTAM